MTILESMQQRHHLHLPLVEQENLVTLAGGYVQYLQIFALILSEHKEKGEMNEKKLFDLFFSDERIALQSEEIWESLTKKEQEILSDVIAGKEVSEEEKSDAHYVWDTGILVKDIVFSTLFKEYVKKRQGSPHEESNHIELSKKEHMLLELLKLKPNEITEREDIVEKVWPEYQEYGVSDWSIDRLVARLRSKLKQQKAEYEIQTIRTRGYKLLTK